MNLAIDIGNTLVKYAVFDNNQIIHLKKSFEIDEKLILRIMKNYNITSFIVSSVRDDMRINIDKEILYLSHNTSIPCEIHYHFIETLGKDRIANIVAACCLYSNKNTLVIDAGSCITLDFIDKDGNYLGGRISPGIEMRYKSLHKFTAKLPKLKLHQNFSNIGTDTSSSIISGVQKGVLAEVDTMISYFDNPLVLS